MFGGLPGPVERENGVCAYGELVAMMPDPTRHDWPGTALGARDVAQLVLVMLLWALCSPLIDTGLAFAPPLHFGAARAARRRSSPFPSIHVKCS